MKTEMWIENKYNIGDMVGFGGYMSMVTGLRLTGKPLNILYEISFFDNCENYKTFVVNDFELETEKIEFGFRVKKEEIREELRERLEAEDVPLKSPFDPRFDDLNCGNQDDM